MAGVRHTRRRVTIAVAPLLLSGAVRAEEASIGTARMLADGTIVMLLMRAPGVGPVHARAEYPPGHPQYATVLRHVGGLRPGEVKPVRPFP
jgi:hypothetical protein